MAKGPVKTIYYRDELNDDFAGTTIKQEKVDENYKFIQNRRLYKISAFFLTYFIAVPLLFLQLKLKYGLVIKNRKVLRKVRKKPVFLYANHTLHADSFIPQAAIMRTRKTYVLANPDATSIKGIKTIVAMLGAIPLPEADANYAATKNFLKAIEHHVNNNRVIAIYPEAHIWPYYTGIRPFTSKSFIYPLMYNAPSIALVTTFKKRKFRKTPRVILTLSDVFMPPAHTNKLVARQMLRDDVYNFMKKIADDPTNYEYYRYIQDI